MSSKKQVVVAFALIILLGAGIIFFNQKFPPRKPLVFEPRLTATPTQNTVTPSINYLTVDVSGAVRNPGVYKFAEGSRIEDAIKEAGGLIEQADLTLSSINRASKLQDGQKISIPYKHEAVPPTPIQTSSSNSQAPSNSGKININTASIVELMTLRGIGEKTAQKIEARRKEKGSFIKIEQLLDEKLVQERYWESIKDNITI